MACEVQVFLLCASLLVVSVVARPQVWDIGFHPNSASRLPTSTEAVVPPVDPNSVTTAAPPPVQPTNPSPAYFDCLSRCLTTSEYNPICGSDSVSYHNIGKLNCAAQCGTVVTMVRAGPCIGLG